MSEIGERPADIPEWATDAAALITTPSGAKQILGWIAGEIPPAGAFNWFQKFVHKWVEYIDAGRPRTFDTLEEATAVSTAGKPILVHEYDPALGFMEVTHQGDLGAYVPAASEVKAVTCTGVYVAVSSGAVVMVFNRTLGTQIGGMAQADTLALAGAPDGTITLVTATRVKRFSTADLGVTWVEDWTKTLAAVAGVDTNGLYTAVVGLQMTGTTDLRILNHADGTTHASYTHGTTGLLAVAVDDTYAYAVGEPASTGGYTLRKFDMAASTLAASSAAHAQNLLAVAVNDRFVFAGGVADTGVTLRAYAKGDLALIWSKSIGAAGVTALHCDQDYLYVGDGNGDTVFVLDPTTGALVYTKTMSDSVDGLYSDGVSLFVCGNPTTNKHLNRLNLGKAAVMVVEGSTQHPYLHQTVVPV